MEIGEHIWTCPRWRVVSGAHLNVKQPKEGWRAQWKRVLSVPAFKSLLTEILSPVVTRAQWEVVACSGILAFVIPSVVVAVSVAVPAP